MECWLVRHGESTWNLDVTGLYTSPLIRPREAAAVCAPMLGFTPEPVYDLNGLSHLAAATAGTAAP